MKLIFLSLFAFLLFSINTGYAQLSGTYTVGGVNPDFATIHDAVVLLQDSGVSGPVTINIRPGTYAEKVDLGVVPGTSAVNTLTFKSENNDSTSVIITDPSSPSTSNYTFHVYQTNFLTIRNLTIRRTGSAQKSCVIDIAFASHYLQIRNNIIECDSSTGFDETGALIKMPLGGINDSSIIISNNVMNKGTYGVFMQGQSIAAQITLTQIKNNIFSNQTYGAIYLDKVASTLIQGNDISTNSNNFAFTGIRIEEGSRDIKILANKISGQKAGDGIYLANCSGIAGGHLLIANNFISAGGNGANGINIYHCSLLDFYYNSINVTSTGNFSAALYLYNVGDSIITIKNNIFVNTGGGLTFYVADSASLASIKLSDYNDLYVDANNTSFAYIDTGFAVDLAGWQTATSMDSHSVSRNPQFVSESDLHAGDPAVNNAAVFIASVTTDIDGQARSNATPDIGADEFIPLLNNLSIVALVSPKSGTCGDSSTVFAISIRNLGTNAQTIFPVHLELTGAVNQNLTQNHSGSLNTYGVDTIMFGAFVNTFQGGTVNITAYSSLTNDQYRLNDTIRTSLTFGDHPNGPTVFTPQMQCDNDLQISATADSGDVLAWFAQASGGDPLFVGNVFSPPVTTDTTFFVESRRGSGSSGCIRITEFEPNDNPSDFVEVQNISGVGFDATGWKVIASDFNEIPNDVVWDLGYFNPGEAQYKDDDFSSSHYWGNNLAWSGGSNGWVMIVDDHDNVVDFAVWDWDTTTTPLSTLIITLNGVDYHVGSEWTGATINSCSFPDDNQRTGNSDNNSSSDWGCDSSTVGRQNHGMASVFVGCGVGACGSPRLPVDVILVPGVLVNLGNDTLVGQPFSITLDAGSGFTSYLWSTGETTQTIIVTTYNSYWVTVTGGPNNCSNSDSINVSLNVGLSYTIDGSEFNIYPNPSSEKLTITGSNNILQSSEISITDVEGRLIDIPGLKNSSAEMYLNIHNLDSGIYFLHITNGNRSGEKRFTVIR